MTTQTEKQKQDLLRKIEELGIKAGDLIEFKVVLGPSQTPNSLPPFNIYAGYYIFSNSKDRRAGDRLYLTNSKFMSREAFEHQTMVYDPLYREQISSFSLCSIEEIKKIK